MTSSSSEPTFVSDRRLRLLSAVLLLGASASILDTTIVNVALDHLRTTFGSSVDTTQWLVTGYLLALAAVIPLTGWAAERYGARRAWMTAVGLFLAGSLACGLAWSLPSLIAFRVLQGLGGGMILPLSMTILTQASGPTRVGRAMATIAFPAQLAPILGPVIGGGIVDSVSWRWLFFVNVPICALALLLAPKFLPTQSGDSRNRLDTVGMSLLTPGLVALAYGISQTGGGFMRSVVLGPIGLALCLLCAFGVYSLHARRPLIDVRLFARRSFGLSSALTFLGGFSMFAGMLLTPLFYQAVRGESTLSTGVQMIPMGVGTMLFILVMGKLSTRIDTRYVVFGGVLLSMLGTVPFALADASSSGLLLLLAQFIRGIGLGASTVPVMTLAFTGLSHAEVPRASAAFSIVQRIGAPFGTAVIAVLLQHFVARAASTGTSLAGAYDAAFWCVFAVSAAPLMLAVSLPRDDRATATPTPTPAVAEI
ncbi:MDR family MFS transporter [soil metagenome]